MKIPYYVVKGGRGFWQPTKEMRQLGFMSVACGPDGPAAHAVAAKWNERWERRSAPRTAAPQAAPDKRKLEYVYFLKTGSFVKIGFSKNPVYRSGEMATAFSQDIDWLLAFRGSRAIEKQLHVRFAAYHQKGEWFRFGEPLERAILRFVALGKIDLRETESERQLENSPVAAAFSN